VLQRKYNILVLLPPMTSLVVYSAFTETSIRDLMVRDVIVTPCPSGKELVAEA